jgi:hypothetical protein
MSDYHTKATYKCSTLQNSLKLIDRQTLATIRSRLKCMQNGITQPCIQKMDENAFDLTPESLWSTHYTYNSYLFCRKSCNPSTQPN